MHHLGVADWDVECQTQAHDVVALPSAGGVEFYRLWADIAGDASPDYNRWHIKRPNGAKTGSDRLGMYLAGLSRHLFAARNQVGSWAAPERRWPRSPEQLNLAVQHYQAGRLLELPRWPAGTILAAAPQDADALASDRPDRTADRSASLAIQHIQCAIHVNGLQAQYYNSLGTAYGSQGRLDEAAAFFMHARARADLAEGAISISV